MGVFANKYVNHFVSNTDKNKEDWYISAFDTISSLATGSNNTDLANIRKLIHGGIDKREYNQILNPFNFKEDRSKSIPGRIRNYDIILNNVRKFIGEYVTSYQEFHVISTLPDEDNEMLDAANNLAWDLLSKKAVNKLKALDGEDTSGQEDIDVQSAVDDFKSRWKDERAINDHNMLEYLRSQTQDAYLYAKAYTDWIIYGRYFIHHKVENDDVVKEVIDPLSAYPLISDADFVEDYDAFYYVNNKSLQDIFAHYSDVLDDSQKKYLRDQFNLIVGANVDSGADRLVLGYYKAILSEEDVNLVKNDNFCKSTNGIEVGTLYYKGFKEIKILKYTDVLGNEFEIEVENDYELNPLIGDNSLTSEWYTVVYVQYRFGSRYKGIYTKPIEVPVQRQMINNNAITKLPITGKVGIFPGFPNHSIPAILFPFQVTINMLHLARERAIITDQGKIAIIPKEMLGTDGVDQEDQMYNMLVIKKLFPTVGDIPNLGSAINAIRDIDLTNTAYIELLDKLIISTTELANTAIDMNRQRAGNTYASDGKATTQEAITRVSMGSAIINIVFDISRCKDYEADIDFSKVAWIDGKKAKFVTTDRQRKFFEVNGVEHNEKEFGISVSNSVEYNIQKQQIQDYAFNLSQNGKIDDEVALDVIVNKNISKLKEIIQIARVARVKREDNQFKQEQQTRQVESNNALDVAKRKIDFDKWKVSTECLNDLLIKEVELTLKDMDNLQQDKNNEVLQKISDQKQALQTSIGLLRRQS